jgi:hypothetical protein
MKLHSAVTVFSFSVLEKYKFITLVHVTAIHYHESIYNPALNNDWVTFHFNLPLL